MHFAYNRLIITTVRRLNAAVKQQAQAMSIFTSRQQEQIQHYFIVSPEAGFVIDETERESLNVLADRARE